MATTTPPSDATMHPPAGSGELIDALGGKRHPADPVQEFGQSAMIATAEAEIKAAIIVAQQIGRNEDDAYGRLMKACERPTFQEKCMYRYPRGGTEISGPSVHMAREFARCWGHTRYGFRVVSANDDRTHLRGWAWDMFTNDYVEQDAQFRNLIYRKKGGWVKPDEREYRELVNKHGAIAERNCLLKILPSDMVEDACIAARRNAEKGIAANVDRARKDIVAAFARFNVSASQLEEHLQHPLTEATPAELQELREIWTSIRDGNGHWSELARVQTTSQTKPREDGGASMDDLTGQSELVKPANPTHVVEAMAHGYETGKDPGRSVRDNPNPPGELTAAWLEGFGKARQEAEAAEPAGDEESDSDLNDAFQDLKSQLEACNHIADVGRVIEQAAGADLSKQEFDELVAIGDHQEERIRQKKGLAKSGEQQGDLLPPEGTATGSG